MKFLESETTELKRTLNKDFAKEVVAFLNTRDGVIYIGIDDNGKVLGVPNIDKTMRGLEILFVIRSSPLPKACVKSAPCWKRTKWLSPSK